MQTLQPSPTTDALNTLRDKLREMFHFAQNELDFGLFRILKLKRAEVNRFIDDELPDIVENALADVTAPLWESQFAKPKEYVQYEGGRRQREWLGDIPENRQNLIKFLREEEREELVAPLETDPGTLQMKLATGVYNHIHNFFERYYRDGDFGYNDRSTALYQVDYPGEADYAGTDILFHWKCSDSYYVKTATGFNSVAFEVEDKRIEYRLEGEPANGTAQNNNRDDFKHYRLARIEPPEPNAAEPTWRVILHLAETSTPKAELYREMNARIFGEPDDVDIYLYGYSRKSGEQGKPLFKELQDNSTDVQSGQIRGIRALRMNLEEYAKKLAEHPDFRTLGKNKTVRQEVLQTRTTVRRFHAFDKNLNRFLVGMDSDYFIHKDLEKFLLTEQRRYIQNSILGALDTLLNLSPENPTFAVAKAFRSVTDEVIELLVAVETFQKSLFLMKKKVLTTDYLISLGKIAEATKNDTAQREALIAQILNNDAQLTEWRDTFNADITEQLPLLEGLYPTLPLDTRHFDADFVDTLLALFDNLEAETTGLLLNSENFQALELLMEKYRGKVKCVHIDPPYNTNTSGFLYKNDYQHASWLTMMENRLYLAEQLMAPESSCILCHIDENEYENLFQLFNQLPLQNQGTIVWDKRNPVFGTKTIATQHEFVVGQSKGNIKLQLQPLNRQLILNKAASLVRKHRGATEECRKEFRVWLRNKPDLSGGERAYSRIDKDGHVYTEVGMEAPGLLTDPKFHEPLIHPTTQKPCRVPANGWSRTPEKMQEMLANNLIVFGPDETKLPQRKVYLRDHVISELSSVISSGERGKHRMDALGLNFPYSHPIGLYEKLVWAVTPDGNGITLDFFAGSGTTGHAVLRLNKADNGERKFILVEMGDYFESTLKERIRRAMFSENWRDGKPHPNKEIDGTVGIVKYQRLEQYEDVLNNLTYTASNTDNQENNSDVGRSEFPARIPVKYLYRPEEQQIRLVLDLRAPFSNRIVYGKDSTEGVVDIVESYCYLKGLAIERRLRFNFGERIYRVVKSGGRLVVFRNVSDEIDDTAQLLEILADPGLAGVRRLDVNFDADQNRLLQHPDLREVYLITTADFDTGTVWEDASL